MKKKIEKLTKIEEERILLIGYFSGNIDFNTNQNENVITEFIKKLDQLINSTYEECAKDLEKLPLFTEIYIQPLDIDDKTGKMIDRIYWIKHKGIKLTCYDKSFSKAVKDFIEISKSHKR